jgi:hypothetical protein
MGKFERVPMNQAQSESMLGENKFDDELGKVASVIRTEQGLLGVTDLLEYF